MLRVLLTVLLVAVSVRAHMRFVCPRPQSPNSGLKRGVCGGEPSRSDVEYMELTPGPMTLQLEESVFHRGAPTRIALAAESDPDKYCVLLDQIPHNDAAKVKLLQPVCPIFKYPIGGCDTSYTYVTVNIPDIKCDRCFLHLISVMTDKYTAQQEPCVADGIKSTNCSTYYSCANIRIRPTTLGAQRTVDSCQSYTSNLLGSWPYMPRSNMFEMGTYRDHGISFSPLGFLRGPEFVGSSATYQMGAEPVGTCAPKQRTCAIVDKRAAVGVSVLEDRLRITAVAHDTGSRPSVRLVINGQVSDFKFNNVTGILDETMIVKLSDGSLESQIKVITIDKDGSDSIVCEKKQFVRFTKQGEYTPRGLAVYSLSDSDGDVLLSYMVRDAESTTGTINGPAVSSEEGRVVANLSTQIAAGAVYGSLKTPISSSQLLHALWSGWMYLTVGGFRAQIPGVEEELCMGNPSHVCAVSRLSVDGQEPDFGQATVPPHGLVSFSVNNHELSATLTIGALGTADQIRNISLVSADGSELVRLAISQQKTSALDSQLRYAEASNQLISGEIEQAVIRGDFNVLIHTDASQSLVRGSPLRKGAAPTAPTTTASSSILGKVCGFLGLLTGGGIDC